MDESGHTGNGQIWYAGKEGNDWNVMGELDPTVDSVEKHFQFSVDKQGNLYFSNMDIYCARHDHGVYEAPEKLPLSSEPDQRMEHAAVADIDFRRPDLPLPDVLVPRLKLSHQEESGKEI
jgi:hypothetical protein